MGGLVDDLLLLARLDQHRPLEQRPVDLLPLAADAVHDAQAAHPQRQILLTVLPDSQAPIVLGDEARLLVEVTVNLVERVDPHPGRRGGAGRHHRSGRWNRRCAGGPR